MYTICSTQAVSASSSSKRANYKYVLLLFTAWVNCFLSMFCLIVIATMRREFRRQRLLSLFHTL